eukprot:TRINITY_DN12438_c0_g1_i1.p1 TRINITY_DN12438_c0_g1~~TRINITY_DN12438_c0_g1_i1.p1  ORF type:complete len:366 (+),score=113.58 TRINITY_DN12438_c0_g1_i1:34-1098(+)
MSLKPTRRSITSITSLLTSTSHSSKRLSTHLPPPTEDSNTSQASSTDHPISPRSESSAPTKPKKHDLVTPISNKIRNIVKDIENKFAESDLNVYPGASPACLSPKSPLSSMSPTCTSPTPRSPPMKRNAAPQAQSQEPNPAGNGARYAPYYHMSEFPANLDDYSYPDPKNKQRFTATEKTQGMNLTDFEKMRSASMPTMEPVLPRAFHRNQSHSEQTGSTPAEVMVNIDALSIEEKPFGFTSATKNAACFLVKERKVIKGKFTTTTKYHNVVLAIDLTGISVLQPFTETVISHHPYKDIKTWKNTATYFHFLWYPPPRKEGVTLVFETLVGDEISKAITEYISRVLAQRKQVKG